MVEVWKQPILYLRVNEDSVKLPCQIICESIHPRSMEAGADTHLQHKVLSQGAL